MANQIEGNSQNTLDCLESLTKSLKLLPAVAFSSFGSAYGIFIYHDFILSALSKEISLLMTAVYIDKW